jgi:hypothetical protein
MNADFLTSAHQAFEGTSLVDVVVLTLTQPPGRGIVNELAHDGPYRVGPLQGIKQTKIDTGVECPYCKSPVLRYEYPQMGLCVFVCREIGFFTRLPIGKMKTENWKRLVRQTAVIWTRIEANRNNGQN